MQIAAPLRHIFTLDYSPAYAGTTFTLTDDQVARLRSGQALAFSVSHDWQLQAPNAAFSQRGSNETSVLIRPISEWTAHDVLTGAFGGFVNSLRADTAVAVFQPGPLGVSVGAGGVYEVNSEGTHADYFEDVVLDDQVPARVSLAWELLVEYSEEWVAVDPEAETQLLRTYEFDEAAVLADRLEKLPGALYRDSDGQIAEDLDAVEHLS